jgi:hypothetical protein
MQHGIGPQDSAGRLCARRRRQPRQAAEQDDGRRAQIDSHRGTLTRDQRTRASAPAAIEHSDQDVRKILGGNVLRVIEAVEPAAGR